MLIFISISSAQSYSADELFQQARKAAFELKDYPQAIQICKQALDKSPDYGDIRIFLGRLYTWSKQPDSARTEFATVLSKQPGNEDASLAYGNLEYWNNNYDKALQLCNEGLAFHPQSEDLLLLKAKILNEIHRYYEANNVIKGLLAANPANTTARSMANRINDNSAANKFGISYDFVNFDKQFDAPWHLASIEYTRRTRLGAVTGRMNYANRFKSNGLQFEMDAYPHISRTFYAYVNGGYSNDVGIFPKYRAGASLYASLPAGFEAEAGFRYIYFSDATWIYTASAGKYYKSYWFNFRTFLTPSNSAISQSYSLNVRYYYGGADDYLSAGIGTGISPDDTRNNVLLDTKNNTRLKSNNLNVGIRHVFKTFNIISFKASIDYQEYKADTHGIQTDIGIGYQRRF